MSKAQYEYWLDSADYDVETAKSMLSSKRYLYVGFMCHLTAEKAAKAIIAHKDEVPPKTHNLTKLMQQSGMYDALSEEQLKLIDKLQPLNIEARYPAAKERLLRELDEQTCRELVEHTEELLSWIKAQQ